MSAKEKITRKKEQLLDDIFDWDVNVNECVLLFGEVEMPEELKKSISEEAVYEK